MAIGLDMMGGDYAPLQAVKGVKAFQEVFPTTPLCLFGDEQALAPLLQQENIAVDHLTVVHASEQIEMHEHPTKALKEKPNSSIAIGFNWLAQGKIDSFASAGNTGAMLVGTHFSIQSLEGVLRPSIATIIPKTDGGTALLLDVGLNVDCKPELLNQFAIMGSVYAKVILGIDSPSVGLLNVGEEPSKGNALAQATYPLLKENKQIHFVGNIEGRDVLSGKADVMVCDGFTGNVILKMAESLYDIARHQQLDNPYFNRFDFENYGGTPVLGITKPVIIGHGISGNKAFYNMLVLAKDMFTKQVMQQMSIALNQKESRL